MRRVLILLAAVFLGILLWSLRDAAAPPLEVPPPAAAPPAAVTGLSEPAGTVSRAVVERKRGPGALELRFLRRGAALSGIATELFEDGDDVPIRCGVSDEHGLVRFELPPGPYRWRLLADLPIPMKPPLEPEREVHTGSARISGPFQIEPGETLAIVLEQSHSTVSGNILAPDGSPAAGAELRLVRQLVEELPDGDYNDGWHREKRSVTDENGRFLFKDVQPSRDWTLAGQHRLTGKLIWIKWTTGNEVFVGKQLFTLDEGESKELGAYRLAGGHDLPVDVVLVDLAGNILRSEDLFDHVPRANLVVSDLNPFDETLAADVFEILDPEVGKRTILRNLPPGRYDLALDRPLRDPFVTCKEGSRIIDWTVIRQIDVPSSAPLELPIQVETGVVPIEIVVPVPEVSPGQLSAILQYRTGEVQRVVIYAGYTLNETPVYLGKVRAAPGDYRLYVTNNATYSDDEVESYFSEMSLSISEPTQITVPLSLGGRITGVSINRLGRIDRDGVAKLRDISGKMIFKANANGDGRFNMVGLPPGWTLFALDGESVLVGSRGVKVGR